MSEYFIGETEDFLRRISILEQRSGLSALDFGSMQIPADPAQRLQALNALAKWRLDRLEALQNKSS